MFSGRELDVMNTLWELGSATVYEILESLSDELAYTTVLTMLQRLEEKGHIRHESEGRAHRYFPLVQREEAQDSAIQRVTRKLFRGSPELLMSRLLNKRGLTTNSSRVSGHSWMSASRKGGRNDRRLDPLHPSGRGVGWRERSTPERLLRAHGLASRWIWAGAMLLSSVWPLGHLVWKNMPREAPEVVLPNLPPMALVMEPLSLEVTPQSVLRLLDGPIISAWIVVSGAPLLFLTSLLIRTRRLRKGWQEGEAGGQSVLYSDEWGPAVVGFVRPQIVLPRLVSRSGQEGAPIDPGPREGACQGRRPAARPYGRRSAHSLSLAPRHLVATDTPAAGRGGRLRPPGSAHTPGLDPALCRAAFWMSERGSRGARHLRSCCQNPNRHSNGGSES